MFSEEKLNQAFHNYALKEEIIAVEDNANNVSKDDFIRLVQKTGWLPDQMMNFYSKDVIVPRQNWLRFQMKQTKLRKWFVSNSYFMMNILQLRHEKNKWKFSLKQAKRQHQKVDLNGYTGHLIPIHIKESHWTLLKVSFMDKILTYMDPIPGYSSNVVDKIFDAYIRYYSEGRADITPAKTTPIDPKEWKKVVLGKSHMTQQSNGYDCGVLCMMFIDLIHLDHSLKFNAELATDYRRLMFNHVAAYVTQFNGL